MNSLNDLYRTFDEQAALARDGHGIVEQARAGAARRRVRRRWQAFVAGLAVVAVAGTTPLVAGALRHDPGPARRTATQTTLDLATGSPFTITGRSSDGELETIDVDVPDHGGLVAAVQVSAGRREVGNLTSGKRVTAGGHDAWYNADWQLPDLAGTAITEPPDDVRGRLTGLGWQLPSGAWLTMRGWGYVAGGNDAGQEDVLRQIAEQVRIGAPREVLVPYRAGWLPPGYVAYQTRAKPPRIIVDYRPAGTAPETAFGVAPLRIAARTPDEDWGFERKGRYEPVAKVGAWPAYQRRDNPGQLAIETPACLLEVIMPSESPGISALRRVAEGLTVADCADPGTWSPLG